jgi:hypothetical protein
MVDPGCRRPMVLAQQPLAADPLDERSDRPLDCDWLNGWLSGRRTVDLNPQTPRTVMSDPLLDCA